MRRSGWRRPVVVGALLGLLWGAVLRVWMRYISTNPEFSWSGTLFIVGATTLVGCVLGLARYRRSRGGIGWWRLSLVTLLLLGAAGAVMWPSVVLGALAVGRRRPVWMVGVATVGAVGVQVPVMQDVVVGNAGLGPARQTLAIGWYAVMLAIQAWGFSVAFAPAVAGAPAPDKLRKTLIAVPLGGVALLSAVLVGMPM